MRILTQPSGEPISFGEASTPHDALRLIASEPWDVVLLDLSLGERSGLELLKEIKDLRPRLPVLVFTMHADERYARRAFRGGAEGYITKDVDRAELSAAIQKIIRGGRYVSTELAEKLVVDVQRGSDRPPHETLSDREFEVLSMIAKGKTVGEIADSLCLSAKTISTYRTRILEKMKMKNSAELTHYAIRNGLVE
jgi:DNA-binding NarL/FixJ family response regulator